MQEKRRYIRHPKFHLSPADNISLIRQRGILTAFDHRQAGRVWLCDLDQVGFVLEHLNSVRQRKVLRWACFSVRWWHVAESLRKSGRPGIYYVLTDIPPNHFHLECTMWADEPSRAEMLFRNPARGKVVSS